MTQPPTKRQSPTGADPRPGRDDIGSAEELHELASRITGLDDFGDPGYQEGLEVLLESYRSDERLTRWGNKATRVMLRDTLVARLLSQAGWKQHPEHAGAPVIAPVFVTGLPRTGTTALHRLLCADPAHQGLELWLTQVPQPRPPRQSWADHPVYQQMQQALERHHVDNPEFMGVHYMSADMVEECWQLLRQSMQSVSFESLAHIPTYATWLAESDWTGPYKRHRRNLQLIGLNDPGRRWVLKNPSHLFALDALLEVYPDAMIVQTHRDPRAVIASSCSLSAQATDGQSELFQGPVIGGDQLELWARGADTFHQARQRFGPGRFFDVKYEDFTANPLGTAEAIYRHFDLDLSEPARTAMAEVHRESTDGVAAPSHRYTLEEFGLSGEEVDERFSDYRRAYR
ncbi:MAG: sulfotransferase family protein [Acidimicrobiales bacterium]